MSHKASTSAVEKRALLAQLLRQKAQQTIVSFHETAVPRLFEAQVRRSPDGVAVIFENEQLTYQALNVRANRVAHHLQSLGIGPESFVVICMERSLEMVVGILGILKAGAAYVPLDPTAPQKALDQRIANVQPVALMTQQRLTAHLSDHEAQIIYPDSTNHDLAPYEINPVCKTRPQNLAYLLPTLDQNILVTHSTIGHHLNWRQQTFALTNSDVLLHKAPLTQDTAVCEIFWPLLTGGRLLIAPVTMPNDPACLLRLMVKQQVSLVHFTPSELVDLLAEIDAAKASQLPSLRDVFCCGEPLSPAIAEKFYQHFTSQLHYLYDLPEAAGAVTWQTVPPTDNNNTSNLPIGQPAGRPIYILDDRLQPVPLGVKGEIYVGDPGLARGYHPINARDEQHFVPNPFSQTGGERLFKTGEFGRRLRNGTFEWLGFRQRRVWLQGFRVPATLVEAALLQTSFVTACRVLARQTEKSTWQLVAYIVPATQWQPERLQAHLQACVPAHMLPHAYVPLSALPLTDTGQIDEPALTHLAVMDADLVRRWQTALQSLSHVTETAVVVQALPFIKNKNSSELAVPAISFPLPGVSLRVVNAQRDVVAEQTIGHIQAKGSAAAATYGQPARTEDGWFDTRETGYLHEGQLTIVDHTDYEQAHLWADAGDSKQRPHTDTTDCRYQQLVAYLATQEETAALSDPVITDRFGTRSTCHYLLVPEIPRTPTGTIEWEALATLANEPARQSASNQEGLCSQVERQLANIWQEVLNVPTINPHDNFFKLGGHSLLASQVMARLGATFQVELPLLSLFEAPTVSKLAERVEAAIRDGSNSQGLPLVPVPREGNLPLSFAQQRLWFLNQFEPESTAHNVSLAARLIGSLDITALEQSLNEVVKRHEILRTSFSTVNGQGVQLIAPDLTLSIQLIDLQACPPQQREAQVWQGIRQRSQQLFDLNQAPLIRVSLFRVGQSEHVILLIMHRIIDDGWSKRVLFGELATLYDAFRTNQPSPLPDLPIQYADFAHWQRQSLQGETLQAHLDYWKQQLASTPDLLEGLIDRPRPAVQTFQGAIHALAIPKSTTEALKTLRPQGDATLFMVLLTAYKLLLYLCTSQTDILVGTPIANRNRPELEKMVGFFVNTLVIRTDLSHNPTFRQLLEQIHNASLAAYDHQDLPFEKLVEELRPKRDLSYTPLFQVWFAFQNFSIPSITLPNLTLHPLDVGLRHAQFDLSLLLEEWSGGIKGHFEYNQDLFANATVVRMAERFKAIIQRVSVQPDIKLNTLKELFDEADQQQQAKEKREYKKNIRQKLKKTKRKSA